MALYNLARVVTATTGAGTITLGSAVSGFLSFDDAGVQDQDTVSYGIKDGTSSEVGTGVYTTATKTLTRNVAKSTNSDTAINLSGSAEVFITPLASDFYNVDTLQEETTAALDDTVPVYDTSASGHRKIQLSNLLNVINALTEDDSPDYANDFVLEYDASASSVKKVKHSVLRDGMQSDLDLTGKSTASQYRSATADKALEPSGVWSAAEPVSLMDAATIAVEFSNGFNFTVTLGGNRTLGNPTNVKSGQCGIVEINQDGTGSRTLAFGANWKFAGGIAPDLTTDASAKDVLSYVALSSTLILATLIADVK